MFSGSGRCARRSAATRSCCTATAIDRANRRRNFETIAVSAICLAGQRVRWRRSIASTMAAFCCVTWSIWLTAVLTSARPDDCSCVEAEISDTRPEISATFDDDLLQRIAGLVDQFDAALDLLRRCVDQRLDLFGGVRRALGQRANFRSDDRETAAGFASARSFDAGVEGQQVGLEGDLVDRRR